VCKQRVVICSAYTSGSSFRGCVRQSCCLCCRMLPVAMAVFVVTSVAFIWLKCEKKVLGKVSSFQSSLRIPSHEWCWRSAMLLKSLSKIPAIPLRSPIFFSCCRCIKALFPLLCVLCLVLQTRRLRGINTNQSAQLSNVIPTHNDCVHQSVEFKRPFEQSFRK